MNLNELVNKIINTASISDKFGKVISPEVVIYHDGKRIDVDDIYLTSDNTIVIKSRGSNEQ